MRAKRGWFIWDMWFVCALYGVLNDRVQASVPHLTPAGVVICSIFATVVPILVGVFICRRIWKTATERGFSYAMENGVVASLDGEDRAMLVFSEARRKEWKEQKPRLVSERKTVAS